MSYFVEVFILTVNSVMAKCNNYYKFGCLIFRNEPFTLFEFKKIFRNILD